MSSKKPPNAGKGRVKGVPNKVTADTRAAIALIAEEKAPQFKKWLERTANGIRQRAKKGGKADWIVKPDPGRAAQIYLAAIEYHIPKLARTEITGKDGKPVTVQVTPPDQAL
jgi:hypothetical protein